jgi:hypothetical protein
LFSIEREMQNAAEEFGYGNFRCHLMQRKALEKTRPFVRGAISAIAAMKQ